jgi:hypothetical protein
MKNSIKDQILKDAIEKCQRKYSYSIDEMNTKEDFIRTKSRFKNNWIDFPKVSNPK